MVAQKNARLNARCRVRQAKLRSDAKDAEIVASNHQMHQNAKYENDH
jgi:hypothetical protein